MSIKNAAPTRRPADRKAQILAAATECFHRSGYHTTAMEDIAGAVGITAGALYRHFRGKQELLSRVLLDGVDALAAQLAEAGDLETMTRTVVGFALDHRSLPMLLERETRNLAEQDRTVVLERTRAHADALAEALRERRPEVDEKSALLVAWCTLALMTSPSHHDVSLPRPRYEALLRAQASALYRSAVVPCPERLTPAPRPTGIGIAPVSRREALLTAAIPLFKQRGFQQVGMEEIGSAAGITGPSIYNHFAGKTEILDTALRREAEVVQFVLARALAESPTHRDALRSVLVSYARLSGMRTSATPLLIAEIAFLPPEQRDRLLRVRNGFVLECVALLRGMRPELSEGQAAVAMRGALVLVNIASRKPFLLEDGVPAEVLADLAMDALDFDPAPARRGRG
ncbi:TetR/AcrR family transcriptional regulator [Streptomyces abyssomicinicus]|uniref:TetR/AcrR family transcriptional regulator n=1 Tax=Streptomyces abyssomicinicus TaxID=574929 RepID=UPI001250ADB6|nr:TetR/AcrR family transcriptional regulator [Streptomyces abyssomicinicus]